HDVASLLLDTVTAALGTGGKTLQRLTLVDVDGRDTEFIDICAVVVLGVGDGRFKSLLDDASNLLRREREDVQRLGNTLAADQIRNETSLLSRDADTTDSRCSFRLLPPGLLVRSVTLESTGQGELAQLVANHVLVDVNGNVQTDIVDGNGQPDEFGQDAGTARPGLDRPFVFARNSRIDLLDQMRVDEWAFLDRT